jgi:hypothetical protein
MSDLWYTVAGLCKILSFFQKALNDNDSIG